MSLPAHRLNLLADSGDEVTLWLGLDLTALSRPRYNVLTFEVIPTQARTTDVDIAPGPSDCCPHPYRLITPYPTSVFNLILPGSIITDLKKKGYSASQLDLKPGLDGFHTHSLTLSSMTDSSFAIIVKYIHVLRMEGPFQNPRMELAVVTLQSLISDDSSADSQNVQDGPHVVTWAGLLEAKHVNLTTSTRVPSSYKFEGLPTNIIDFSLLFKQKKSLPLA